MKKLGKKKFKYLLIMIVCFIVFIIAGYKVATWIWDNQKTKNIENDIQNVITENSNNDIPSENTSADNTTTFLDLPMDKLKELNNEVVGYLKVNGTKIDYPIVQHTDNEYYLTRDFYKEKNADGWPFLDYRNDFTKLDKNNIIYGHSLKNGIMFGSLIDVTKPAWQNVASNHIIQVSTLDADTTWQVFSTYTVSADFDYIKTDFTDDNTFLEYANTLKAKSNYNYNVTLNTNDKILTLSTCVPGDNSERVVLHAKLISSEKR